MRSERPRSGGIDKEQAIKVTLDFGARASCWPAGLLTEVQTKPKLKGVRLRASNGEDLQHHGRKDVQLKPVREGPLAACNST